jgi:hypothetical protein
VLDHSDRIKGLVRIALGSSCFLVGGPSPSTRSGGTIFDTGYMVPQLFAVGGNRIVSRFVGP